MPELPEVETIRSQLADRLVGKRVLKVHIHLPKIFFGEPDVVVGATITSVERRAKILLIKLSNKSAIAVHLKMTGQLVYGEVGEKKLTTAQAKSWDKTNGGSYYAETVSFSQGIPFAGFTLPGKSTHVVFDLSDGAKLFFNDNRQFGWVKIVDEKGLQEIHEKHGPEPFSKDFTPEYLQEICEGWGRAIKLLLMEQGKIAGIGNIYANEALWCAGILPDKKAKELAKESPEKIKKLHECILDVLKMGIKYQGSSAHAESYVTALGEKGTMQDHFVVYSRPGNECPRCKGKIQMSRIGGRGTFFCPGCQS